MACCGFSSSSLSELSPRGGKAGVRESSPTSQTKLDDSFSRGASAGLVCFSWKIMEACEESTGLRLLPVPQPHPTWKGRDSTARKNFPLLPGPGHLGNYSRGKSFIVDKCIQVTNFLNMCTAYTHTYNIHVSNKSQAKTEVCKCSNGGGEVIPEVSGKPFHTQSSVLIFQRETQAREGLACSLPAHPTNLIQFHSIN